MFGAAREHDDLRRAVECILVGVAIGASGITCQTHLLGACQNRRE
jgi:hypothetical protein